LLQLGLSPDWGGIPVPGYLIQTEAGTNVLVDTGYAHSIFGRREEAAVQLQDAFPDDKDAAWSAEIIRSLRDDASDFIVSRLAMLGLAPSDINILVCTHFDFDHSGNHDLFPQAELVVQRRHYAVARASAFSAIRRTLG
jgi:N-acyl homoserine lactone hydrolase